MENKITESEQFFRDQITTKTNINRLQEVLSSVKYSHYYTEQAKDVADMLCAELETTIERCKVAAHPFL